MSRVSNYTGPRQSYRFPSARFPRSYTVVQEETENSPGRVLTVEVSKLGPFRAHSTGLELNERTWLISRAERSRESLCRLLNSRVHRGERKGKLPGPRELHFFHPRLWNISDGFAILGPVNLNTRIIALKKKHFYVHISFDREPIFRY